jgi:hypothetical protein
MPGKESEMAIFQMSQTGFFSRIKRNESVENILAAFAA